MTERLSETCSARAAIMPLARIGRQCAVQLSLSPKARSSSRERTAALWEQYVEADRSVTTILLPKDY